MKSKMEPVTNRIKRLLEVLSLYSFNLYYIKGKDMVLSDYLSRYSGDRSDLHEVIPVSFDMKDNSLKSGQNNVQDTFMVQTRSQAKDVKAPATRGLACSMHKKAKDIKPIIIDDDEEQDISNLDKNSIVIKKLPHL